jgi:hypothetical protein
VREVTIADDAPAAATVESLLMDPKAAPWPELLKNKAVRVRPTTPPPDPSPAADAAGQAAP